MIHQLRKTKENDKEHYNLQSSITIVTLWYVNQFLLFYFLLFCHQTLCFTSVGDPGLKRYMKHPTSIITILQYQSRFKVSTYGPTLVTDICCSKWIILIEIHYYLSIHLFFCVKVLVYFIVKIYFVIPVIGPFVFLWWIFFYRNIIVKISAYIFFKLAFMNIFQTRVQSQLARYIWNELEYIYFTLR